MKFVLFLLHSVIVTSAYYLNPSVFKNLSRFPLPEVNNDVTMSFQCFTYENTLLDAVSYNATYDIIVDSSATRHPSLLSLFIPLEELHLKGKYHAVMTLSENEMFHTNTGRNPTFHQEEPLSSRGAYVMTMTGAHLNFVINVQKVESEIYLQLFYCSPSVEELNVEISPDQLKDQSLDSQFLHHMIRVAAKRDFSEMFCDAMRGLVQSREHFVIKAIHSRIKQFEAGKASL